MFLAWFLVQLRYAAGVKDMLERYFKGQDFPVQNYIVKEGKLAGQYQWAYMKTQLRCEACSCLSLLCLNMLITINKVTTFTHCRHGGYGWKVVPFSNFPSFICLSLQCLITFDTRTQDNSIAMLAFIYTYTIFSSHQQPNKQLNIRNHPPEIQLLHLFWAW